MSFKASHSRTVSDSVYMDIIATLYGTQVPIAVTGMSQVIVGTIAAWQTRDVLTAALTGAGMLLALVRAYDVVAFRRRVARKPPIGRIEAEGWEWRYAIGSVLTAFVIGLFAARCVSLGDTGCSAMATGLAFGFGAGVVARLSLRPVVAMLDLAFTSIPAIAATFLLAADATHIGLGVLFAIYLIGSFEMVRLSYNANLSHITLKREFEQLARRDPMTGLLNRTALATDLVRLIADCGANMVAVHAVDLDRFKDANDKFGHPFGDALLRQVAGRLRSIAAEDDLLVRMGGDEFILVQRVMGSQDDAEAMAKRIFATISAPYCIDGHDIVIGASIGVAVSPADGRSVEALLARSDQALYQAKAFRGGYVLASDLNAMPALEAAPKTAPRQHAA